MSLVCHLKRVTEEAKANVCRSKKLPKLPVHVSDIKHAADGNWGVGLGLLLLCTCGSGGPEARVFLEYQAMTSLRVCSS